MDQQHTRGPWHVAGGGQQIRSARDQIARVWMMRDGEGKANAAFIVRACNAHYEMRNLLEEAARYLRHDPQTDLELVARIEAKLADLAAGSAA
jgi:hypothetical protein